MSQIKKQPKKFDLVGLGNALIDVVVSVEEEELKRYGLKKSFMQLISQNTLEKLDKLPVQKYVSGGAVANTVAGFAALGGRAAFMGRLGDDKEAEIYRGDLRALGVYVAKNSADVLPSGRCYALITPDGERTMGTFLGASAHFQKADLDRDVLESSRVCLVEGFLWGTQKGRAALLEAAHITKAAGGKVAFALCDADCAKKHKKQIREFVQNTVDIFFANEHEVTALYGSSLEDALKTLSREVRVGVVTRSHKGAVVLGATRHVQKACAVPVVDTTGAGDLFAAGFLFAWFSTQNIQEAARLGTQAAALIVQQFGARAPKNALTQLTASATKLPE